MKKLFLLLVVSQVFSACRLRKQQSSVQDGKGKTTGALHATSVDNAIVTIPIDGRDGRAGSDGRSFSGSASGTGADGRDGGDGTRGEDGTNANDLAATIKYFGKPSQGVVVFKGAFGKGSQKSNLEPTKFELAAESGYILLINKVAMVVVAVMLVKVKVEEEVVTVQMQHVGQVEETEARVEMVVMREILLTVGTREEAVI